MSNKRFSGKQRNIITELEMDTHKIVISSVSDSFVINIGEKSTSKMTPMFTSSNINSPHSREYLINQIIIWGLSNGIDITNKSMEKTFESNQLKEVMNYVYSHNDYLNQQLNMIPQKYNGIIPFIGEIC